MITLLLWHMITYIYDDGDEDDDDKDAEADMH